MTNSPDGAGAAPDISFVVPVFNAAPHLEKLTAEILSLHDHGLTVEVIFVDDGSTDDSPGILAALAQRHDNVTALTSPGNRGAGLARNQGWDHVRGRYTLFFDADDDLMPEVIAPALARMDALPQVDTAMFAYRYEREETATFTAMGHDDEAILREALNGTDEAVITLEQAPRLLRFTNYPWNKIIRTAHFRETGIRFGCTKVHNDVLGHWYSLMFARQIMVVNRVICTHIVHPSGGNLTNRFDRQRLQVFTAMNELLDLLEQHPHLRRRYAHHFWGLAHRLVVWARPRLTGDLRLELEDGFADLIARISLDDLARMRTKHAPGLARALVSQMIA
ncbi:MAG: glycosyltransferase [Paracoccus sp. (in: a-proteobacteria)]|uniref:glycosyltransferase family 2 protein n=1 Tax=Paracoccus sp. TaxID=267 RepID=UPI0026DFE348|nr:glycosyltransferase family 2 protein [Paracoccus sp. (in: a-proteobacteria)]MDO5612561.1 glycosyltransferase [Paracoccus sp. (in: a-proteobacteria)]